MFRFLLLVSLLSIGYIQSMRVSYGESVNQSALLPLESWTDYRVMFMYAHIDGTFFLIAGAFINLWRTYHA
jgi:hypothetical protein